jgi:predicted PurR-regulated permease PerM
MGMGDWSFWEFLWTTFLVFIWISVLLIFFNVVVDVFRSRDLSGVKKAIWLIVLLILPLIGMLVYVFARGDGMAGRALERQLDQAEQLRQAVGAGTSPADQIASAKQLLDNGTITTAEFEQLKRQALGS